jgi:hypothetical protein
MAQSALDTEIRSKIESFLGEITALVRKDALDSVREALGNGTTPVRRGPGRPRGSMKSVASVGANGRRTSADVDATAQRLVTFVGANPGLRLEQIAAGLGVTTNELKLPVIKLLSSKVLKKTGERRGTKYFAGNGRSRGGKS